MADNLDRLEAEVSALTEIKTPGAQGSDIKSAGDDIAMADQFRNDFSDTIKTVKLPDPDTPETQEQTTAAPIDPNLTKFDASSYVEQGVVIIDKLLQMGFSALDKATTLHKEDRQALDYLLHRTKNGDEPKTLDKYDRWLLAQGDRLSKNSEDRQLTDSEKDNIVNALKAMPWINDKLLTPQNQLTWAIALYFGARLIPVAFNLFGGKQEPPEDAFAKYEPVQSVERRPPHIVTTHQAPVFKSAEVVAPQQIKPVTLPESD